MKVFSVFLAFFVTFVYAEIVYPLKTSLKHKSKTTLSPDSSNVYNYSNFNETPLAEFIALIKDIKINVVAPASDITEEKMEKLKNITSLNLNIPSNCFSGNDSELPIISVKNRFQCLFKAIYDDTATVIWTLRGGYGSAKLIPYLQKLPKPKIEKSFIGFSDITALHLFFTQKWGWKSIHGNGISEILDVDEKYDVQNFIKVAKIISRKNSVTIIPDLIQFNSVANFTKIITGKLTGGNLAIIETSLETKWKINTKDKIIFLEDVNVEPYMIDRSLTHLKQAGIFEDVKAIIFGTFSNESDDVLDVLRSFSKTLKIPVFKTNKFGHERFNFPIIYNTFAQIVHTFNNTFNLGMKF